MPIKPLVFAHVNLTGGYQWVSEAGRSLGRIPSLLQPCMTSAFENRRDETCDILVEGGAFLTAKVSYLPNDIDEIGREGLIFVLGKVAATKDDASWKALKQQSDWLIAVCRVLRSEGASQRLSHAIIASMLTTISLAPPQEVGPEVSHNEGHAVDPAAELPIRARRRVNWLRIGAIGQVVSAATLVLILLMLLLLSRNVPARGSSEGYPSRHTEGAH
jgi:hypothetical protein